MLARKVFSKGDILICSNCKDQILKFNANAYTGHLFECGLVTGIQRPLSPGDRCECSKCGTDYGHNLLYNQNACEIISGGI